MTLEVNIGEQGIMGKCQPVNLSTGLTLQVIKQVLCVHTCKPAIPSRQVDRSIEVNIGELSIMGMYVLP